MRTTAASIPATLQIHMLMQRFVRAAVTFLVLFVAACQRFSTKDVPAKVLELEGRPRAAFGQQPVGLTSNTWLRTGTTINVPSASRLDIMLLPGILLELSHDADLEILNLQIAKDGNEDIHPMTAREARVRLRRGTVVASVLQSQTRSRLLIETPDGRFRAGAGRTFELALNGSHVRAICARGEIRFTPSQRSPTLGIRAGYFVALPNERGNPRAVSTAGREVQAEVVLILEREEHLSHLVRDGLFPPKG